jgi:hypothetical protein
MFVQMRDWYRRVRRNENNRISKAAGRAQQRIKEEPDEPVSAEAETHQEAHDLNSVTSELSSLSAVSVIQAPSLSLLEARRQANLVRNSLVMQKVLDEYEAGMIFLIMTSA